MAFVHGKETYISLNAVDLSAFCNNSEHERNADEHDVTCYGKSAHVFKGGLKGGKNTVSGIYDDTAAGPRATVDPLVGTVVELIHRPEGTGTGKPQDTVDVHVKSYKESAAVADMRMWTMELTYSDDVVTTDQT